METTSKAKVNTLQMNIGNVLGTRKVIRWMPLSPDDNEGLKECLALT